MEPTHGRPLLPQLRPDELLAELRRGGLANLADRAGLLSGSMRMEPADGGGTELEWRVPLRHEGG